LPALYMIYQGDPENDSWMVLHNFTLDS
jgi:hypothetical protein